MPVDTFALPLWFDIVATFIFALTGGLAAIHRKYDVVGLFFLAFATGLGGGLIRDGIFLQNGVSPLILDPRYFYTVLAASAACMLFGRRIKHFEHPIAMIDALGLGAYACLGAQKSLSAGLPLSAAVLVGVINACGGGLMREVIAREEPLVFKPGQFYVLTAAAGGLCFGALVLYTALPAMLCAFIATALTFGLRMGTLYFGWKTHAVGSLHDDEPQNPS